MKAPGIMLLKLKYDKSLSIFVFKFNLSRYNQIRRGHLDRARRIAGPFIFPHRVRLRRPIHGKAVQVEPMKPMLKAPGTKRL
jgi:hypothetical protein